MPKPAAESTSTRAERSRQELAKAKATAAAWRELHERAEAEEARIRARVGGGDDTVTDMEWMTSKARTERTEELVRAGAALVQRAQAALVNDDTQLGEVIHDLLTALYAEEASVKVVTMRDEVTPDPKGGPALYILQDKPGQEDGGILSGQLTLTYFRSRRTSPLDPSEIEQACEARGFSVLVQDAGTQEMNGRHEDTVRVQVLKAFWPIPTLSSRPDESAVRHFAQGVVGPLLTAVRYKGERKSVHLIGESSEASATAALVSCQIQGTETGDNDERMTVRASFAVQPSQQANGQAIATALRNAVVNCTGIVEPGAGKVVSVTDVGVEVPNHVPGVPLSWRVTATFVLSYRIA